MAAGGRPVGFLHQLGDLPAGPHAFVGQTVPVELIAARAMPERPGLPPNSAALR